MTHLSREGSAIRPWVAQRICLFFFGRDRCCFPLGNCQVEYIRKIKKRPKLGLGRLCSPGGKNSFKEGFDKLGLMDGAILVELCPLCCPQLPLCYLLSSRLLPCLPSTAPPPSFSPFLGQSSFLCLEPFGLHCSLASSVHASGLAQMPPLYRDLCWPPRSSALPQSSPFSLSCFISFPRICLYWYQ